ncbi:MAG: anthranilate synthase component I family protein [Phycisphaerales bacterium]
MKAVIPGDGPRATSLPPRGETVSSRVACAQPISLCNLQPLDVLAAWPAAWPLASVWSGDAQGAPDGTPEPRWTILARAGETALLSTPEELAATLARTAVARDAGDSAPCAGWIGWLSYDLGRIIEPASAHRANAPAAAPTWQADREWPLICLRRCDAYLAYDHNARQWWLVGSGPSARDLRAFTDGMVRSGPRPEARTYALAPPDQHQLAANHARFCAGVDRIGAHLLAGDTFEVNLAHRLSSPFDGSCRAAFAHLAASARPWHGAYIEADTAEGRRVIASASPELFLRFDPATRRIQTRPMKGTRRADADPAELLASDKDRAELTMIVDLMRSDLGRVALPGSVRVDTPRRVERHASGVLQTTAGISAVLRPDVGIAQLLRATFPPGSVTGAPKVRAMQIIEELEPVRRGPYCGALGFFGDDGGLALSVAIRTALISGGPHADALRPGEIMNGTLDYSVGAGIVADSHPEREWEETLDKAGVLSSLRPGGT